MLSWSCLMNSAGRPCSMTGWKSTPAASRNLHAWPKPRRFIGMQPPFIREQLSLFPRSCPAGFPKRNCCRSRQTIPATCFRRFNRRDNLRWRSSSRRPVSIRYESIPTSLSKPLGKRLDGLIRTLSTIYLRLIIAEDLTADFPLIPGQWCSVERAETEVELTHGSEGRFNYPELRDRTSATGPFSRLYQVVGSSSLHFSACRTAARALGFFSHG